jgi:hypothetical protein
VKDEGEKGNRYFKRRIREKFCKRRRGVIIGNGGKRNMSRKI